MIITVKSMGFVAIWLVTIIISAIIVSFVVSYALEKKKYVLFKGAFISAAIASTFTDHSSYLDSVRKANSVPQFVNSIHLQEFQTNFHNLEGLQDGHASKFFLSGRGSWRVTLGNILSKEEFEHRKSKEYSKTL